MKKISILSPEKRKIYSRKIRNFWIDFSHNKRGFLGLAILLFFVVMAVGADVLAPQNPIMQKKVAGKYAKPEWIKIFPGYQDLPPTQYIKTLWNESVDYPNVNAKKEDGRLIITYHTPEHWNASIEEIYNFTYRFNYTYAPPPGWTFKMIWEADFSGLDYRIEIYFVDANGSEYIIWGVDYDTATKRVIVDPKIHVNIRTQSIEVTSGSTDLLLRLYYEEYFIKYYNIYMERYGYVANVTPEFRPFSVEGMTNRTVAWIQFVNKSQTEDPEKNPIYERYLTDVKNQATNLTWPEYWETWINSTEAITMFNATFDYCSVNWENFVVESYNNTWVQKEYELDVSKGNFNGTYDEYYYNYWIPNRGLSVFYNKYIKSLTYVEELALLRAQDEAHTRTLSMPSTEYWLQKGNEYKIKLKLYVQPKADNASLTLTIKKAQFIIWGGVYGILGTNSFGYDVWTQLVHGARISLIVGILAAILSTTLGIFFGVASGYVGGIVDEITMRIVDILLCLPVLPLLLALSAYFKPNVYYLVILIAIFGWQGLSRVIRSRVLSLREMEFIEAAKASGASGSYLIFRHLIPNVFPIAMASMVLSVPAAILTEAALSFLGFGDPLSPTWGKMLHEAQSEGAFGAMAWWYILPPGLAMTALCVGFVLIGHALDEIVNPRLRRRR